MKLNGKELAAILKAGYAMVKADGVVKNEELAILFHELKNFGVPEAEAPRLLAASDAMDGSTMVQTLSQLATETKKYVAGYLATIMVVDGDIDDSEVKVWQFVSTLCQFPTMNIKEAVDYWKSY